MYPEATGVEGSGGQLKLQWYGTIRYTVSDDDGQPHVLEIPHTAYIPDLKYRLLAPQYIKTCEKEMGILDGDNANHTRLEKGEKFLSYILMLVRTWFMCLMHFYSLN